MDLTLLLPPLIVGAVLDVVMALVFVLFVASAVLMTVVILLQEGKGGGLGGAFGGAAADTFGVKAGTVNRFTAYLAASFLGLALLYAGLSARTGQPASLELTPSGGIPSDEPAVEMPPDAPDGGSLPPTENPGNGG